MKCRKEERERNRETEREREGAGVIVFQTLIHRDGGRRRETENGDNCVPDFNRQRETA